MAESKQPPPEQPQVELKNPGFAALLAWLIPGAGHFYQGRTAKGVLFMVCILGTFFYGLTLGQGHVVYASWEPNDKRLPYFCQVGAGLPAMPALLQATLVRGGKEPITIAGRRIMAPPRQQPMGGQDDELSLWHYQAGPNYEMGTLFTMIAGLLNILAIYDAFAGPVFTKPKEESNRPPPGDKKKAGEKATDQEEKDS